MIRNFRSRALKRFWQYADARKLPAEDVDRIRAILTTLEAAEAPADMNIHGLRFHALKVRGDGESELANHVRLVRGGCR